MQNIKNIYLDNSATTCLCPAAKQRIAQMLDVYGNPSSLHGAGLAAERELKAAKQTVLRTLGIRASKDEDLRQLVFTSCGTEATSLALFGTAYAKQRREANRIITTDSEHPSVENALRRLESDGFEVVRLSTVGGAIDLSELDAALDRPVFLATFMMVNNETGALYDVKTLFDTIRKKYPNAITHCDAVQGYLKCKFTPSSIGADLVTISAHKVHGPKGVGALYVSPSILKEKKLVPFLVGGGQEYGMRSGTENTIGICAFASAAESVFSGMPKSVPLMRELREYCAQLLSKIDGIKINAPKGSCAPHVLSVTLPDIKSQTMLNFLSNRGIYLSSGSACSSHSNKTSSTLLAFGLDAHSADCTLRISFCEYNTKEDCEALANALEDGVKTLVRIR